MSNDRKRKKNGAPDPSRRRFLGQASCAAVGTTAMFNTVLNMGMFNSLACTTPSDYKAMVCLFLGGGIDSYNLVVPRGDTEYAEYAATRSDLALQQDELLEIMPATRDGRDYGLHPNVPELQALFESGRLALLSNVGTLVEPTTLDQYRSRSVGLPLGLFSHSDQSMHWQTSIPDQRNASGWAGRIADMLEPCNTNQNIAMNISLSGSNVFQSGDLTAHYTIGLNGSTGLRDYGQSAPEQLIRTQAIDGLLGLQYQNVFEKTFATRMRSAIDAHVEFSAAIDGVLPFQTVFSATRLSQQFRMIAQTIAARAALGIERQTFFVSVGGWDHHDEVLVNQQNQLPVVSAAIGEFYSALDEINAGDAVTTFTASDFGRTLSSNGRGSDHAWGGNHLVVGGAVNGGDMYGIYPELYLGNPLDTGRGRLIPTTSVDEMSAELALWFGVPAADLEMILPNISRFWSPSSSTLPLGFMQTGAAGPPTNRSVRDIEATTMKQRGKGRGLRRRR